MKDVISLLITTSCLAVAGVGIYLFSYKSDEGDSNQKGGKKRNNTKQNFELDEYDYNDADDTTTTKDKNDDHDKIDHHDKNDDHDKNDGDTNQYDFENYTKVKKSAPKTSKSKTKRNRNKFTVSKKYRYY